MTRRKLAALFTIAFVGATGARAETVHMLPDKGAGWSMRNVLAPLRPGHFYGERTIEIDTTPPGALVDLFYVRSGFQLRYEQAEAPVTVVLPSRIKASTKDSLQIRATLDGYRPGEHSIRVTSGEDRVRIELDPLPNTLEAVAHTYFAGRAALSFLTKESLTLRMQKARDGFSVVLNETAATPEASEALRGVKSPLVEGVDPKQLGEDLVVRVDLAPPARDGKLDLRSRSSHDPVRRLYQYAIDLLPADGDAGSIARARAALDGIGTPQVTGCALEYDGALREQLDAEALARALTPSGRFTDRYLRAAMKRLGEVSPRGVISLVDDSTLRPSVPIELTAAMSQAPQARGYLALLRSFVDGLEPRAYRTESLRSLIAPELSPAAFDAVQVAAATREKSCRVGG